MVPMALSMIRIRSLRQASSLVVTSAFLFDSLLDTARTLYIHATA